jgi:hypothetical protein
MKKIFIMMVMLTGVYCLFAQDRETCQKFYDNGMTEFHQGDYTKAKKIFSQGLKMSCSDYNDFQKRIEDCDAKIKGEAEREKRRAEEAERIAREAKEEAELAKKQKAEAERKISEEKKRAEEAERKARVAEAERNILREEDAERKARVAEAERNILREEDAERKASEDWRRREEAEYKTRKAEAEVEREKIRAEEAERRAFRLEREYIVRQKSYPRQRKVFFGATMGTSFLIDSEYEVTDSGQCDVSFGYLFNRYAGVQLSLAATNYSIEDTDIGFVGLYIGPLLNLPFNRSGSVSFEIYPAIGIVEELTGTDKDNQVSGNYSFSGRVGGGFRFHAGPIYFRLGANYIYSRPGELDLNNYSGYDLSSYGAYVGIGLGF